MPTTPTSTNGQNQGKVKDNTRLLGLASIAGDSLDLLSAFKRQKIAKEAAAYRIRSARFNAESLALQAQETMALGGTEAAVAEGKAASIAENQGLGLAASGAALSGPDAAALRLSSTMLGEIDASSIRHNALREALGLEMQGQALLAQAYSDSAATKSAARPSLLKAGLNLGKTFLNLE